jgi:hypothetical protein
MSSSRRGRSLAEVMAPIEDGDAARPRSQAAPNDSQPAPDAAARLAADAAAGGQAVVSGSVSFRASKYRLC